MGKWTSSHNISGNTIGWARKLERVLKNEPIYIMYINANAKQRHVRLYVSLGNTVTQMGMGNRVTRQACVCAHVRACACARVCVHVCACTCVQQSGVKEDSIFWIVYSCFNFVTLTYKTACYYYNSFFECFKIWSQQFLKGVHRVNESNSIKLWTKYW